MSVCGFASLPTSRNDAVILRSRRSADNHVAHAAAAAADAMVELATHQPGFLGSQATRHYGVLGIKVSSRINGAAIPACRNQSDHASVRAHGLEQWYDHHELRVAIVERAEGSKSTP